MSVREELVAAALESAPFTVALVDGDGTVVWVNEAWRTFAHENGLDHPTDGVGLNYLAVAEAAHGDDYAEQALSGLRAVLDGDQPAFAMEYPCHSPDERRWFRLHARLVDAPDHDQRERPCLVTHQDITDPVERELLAQHQREELERLASMLSHDVRNPVTVARTWAEYLASEETYDPTAVTAISDALVRIETIIEDAVTLLRTGLDASQTELCSLAAIARDAWSTVQTENATLTVEGDLTLSVNPGLLRSVLENLFQNSVEHGSTSSRSRADNSVEHGSTPDAAAPEPVAVRVGVLDDGDGFFVADDGPGIPPAIRDDVFEFGFSTGTSSGLGLAIVAQIASLYDWSLFITESADGGARVEIRTIVADSEV